MGWQATLQAAQPFAVGGVFLLLYAAEHLYPARKELIDYRHDVRNLAVGVLNAVLIFGLGFLFQKEMAWYNAKGFGLLNVFSMPAILRYGLEFLVLDCAMYWWHRANHRWPWLWRFHRFHHEDTNLNSTSALRFHAAELGLSYIWRALLFPLVGVSVAGFLFYSIVFSAVVVFHHSAVRIGAGLDDALGRALVTPHMHRLHHSIVRREADSNYGSVLPWWDWLFGSYRRGCGETVRFGVED